MADYNQAYEKMIVNEGGYKLHNEQDDRGGQTFAGIARNKFPSWLGWEYIDHNDLDNPELIDKVRHFYEEEFWNKIRGDQIEIQSVAETLFDFSVNAGYRTAIKLTQQILDTTPDGIIGPITLGKLNRFDSKDFNNQYALAKFARYAEIVNHDRSQEKFLLGWINRTLKSVA